MKTTPSSVFIIAAVCSVALSSHAMARGHRHRHKHRSHDRMMMPGDRMMMMGDGMTAAKRHSSMTGGKSSLRQTSAASHGRNR